MAVLDATTKTRSMTPDEVLAVINDAIRRGCGGDQITEESDAPIIDRGTTVVQLQRILWDIDDDADVIPALAWLFVDEITEKQLQPFLAQPKRVTVGELCDYLAPRARIEAIRPAAVLGAVSWEAALFRAARCILAQAGADVSNLRPSSELDPYLRSHGEVMQTRIARLAPGWMPGDLKLIYRPLPTVLMHAVVIGWASGWVLGMGGLLLGMISSWSWPWRLMVGGWVLCFLGWVVHWLIPRTEPVRAQLGEFETFRDLYSALGAHYHNLDREGADQRIPVEVDDQAADEFGGPCPEARVFQKILAILHEDGADVSRVRPSTMLEAFLRGHRAMFESRIALLAPGVVPEVGTRLSPFVVFLRERFEPILWVSVLLCVPVFVILALVYSSPRFLITATIAWIAATLLFAAAAAILDVVARHMSRLGGCATFADLCRLIAEYRRNERATIDSESQ